MKKFIYALLVTIIFTLLMAPVSVGAATVKISKTKMTLNEGKTYTLKITGTTKTVKWTTSDKKIATVSTKGKVTAVKAGKATITATVSSKKYTCTVTVKEVFDAEKALSKLDIDHGTIGSNVIGLFKNNYTFPIQLEATVIYYDEDGSMVGTTSNSNYYLNAGNSCVLYFYAPYDDDLNSVEYYEYELNYVVSQVSDGVKSNLSDIKVEANITTDSVIAKITNNGEASDYTTIGIVFYNDGYAVGYNEFYADMDYEGAVDVLKFYFPTDENYDPIEVDDFDIFVNYSYSFTY